MHLRILQLYFNLYLLLIYVLNCIHFNFLLNINSILYLYYLFV